jgi:phosphopantetheinyl transferase (holo-ACP synthase)
VAGLHLTLDPTGISFQRAPDQPGRRLRWTEVSTVLHPGQPPRVHLLGEVAAMARASGHPDVIAAVSHTDTWAMAYVLLVGEEGAAPPGR